MLPNLPSVSILVPARNEAQGIGACVRSLLALDYPAFNLIVIDDGSTDGTGEIVQAEFAQTTIETKLVRNEQLPPGWIGKTYALQQGLAHADGDWLLFTDADTWHYPASLRTAISFAQAQELDLLSYSPEQECATLWEKIAQPMVFNFLNRAFPLSEINRGARPAAANGQYILVHRAAYERIGGHAAVRDNILEDVALARRAQAQGLRVGFYPGAGLVRTRMYQTRAEIWRGWTKGLFPLLEYRLSAALKEILITMLLYLLPSVGLLVAGWLYLNHATDAALGTAVVASGALLPVLANYYRSLRVNRLPRLCLWLWPVSAVFFILLLMASVHRHRTQRVQWKDRVYAGQAKSVQLRTYSTGSGSDRLAGPQPVATAPGTD